MKFSPCGRVLPPTEHTYLDFLWQLLLSNVVSLFKALHVQHREQWLLWSYVSHSISNCQLFFSCYLYGVCHPNIELVSSHSSVPNLQGWLRTKQVIIFPLLLFHFSWYLGPDFKTLVTPLVKLVRLHQISPKDLVEVRSLHLVTHTHAHTHAHNWVSPIIYILFNYYDGRFLFPLRYLTRTRWWLPWPIRWTPSQSNRRTTQCSDHGRSPVSSVLTERLRGGLASDLHNGHTGHLNTPFFFINF